MERHWLTEKEKVAGLPRLAERESVPLGGVAFAFNGETGQPGAQRRSDM